MGKYREIEGDLIELLKEQKFDVIVHGCNCQKMMGAGIALQIKKEIPGAYEVDKKDKRHPIEKFGGLSYYFDNDTNTYIVNLYTQLYPGPNFDLDAFRLGLKKIKLIFNLNTFIGFPLIGCGIGGGNWEEVSEAIKEILDDYDVTIVRYNK